jgi:hypothetical protein
MIKNVYWSCTLYSCPVLMKREISGQIFKKKSSNIKLHENQSGEGQIVPRGHTDRRTKMTKLIVV